MCISVKFQHSDVNATQDHHWQVHIFDLYGSEDCRDRRIQFQKQCYSRCQQMPSIANVF